MSELELLEKSVNGRIVMPSNPEFDQARKVWNGSINKRPAAVIYCNDSSDVASSIRFARSAKMEIAVRTTGHSIAGHSTSQGGLVLDLSRLKGIDLNTDKNTIRVGAGVSWGEFDRATQKFGLGTTGGPISTMGIAGFTLSGGISRLARFCGVGCDNLISVELVTADGRIVKSSTAENPDLFWGIRGAGANFGVVTSFEIKLHKFGPELLTGAVMYPIEKSKEVFDFCSDYLRGVPNSLGTSILFRTMHGPSVPPDLAGKKTVAVSICYAGSVEEGQKIVKPLRENGSPMGDQIKPTQYVVTQSMHDGVNKAGMQNWWASCYLKEITPQLGETVANTFASCPSPMTIVQIQNIGGVISEIGEDETAYSNRSADFILKIEAKWLDPAKNQENIQWVREMKKAVEPYSTGASYLEFCSEFSEETVRKFYGERKVKRLQELKSKYDPTNLLKSNYNIPR